MMNTQDESEENTALKLEMLRMIKHHKWERDFQARHIAKYRKALDFAIQFIYGDGNLSKAQKEAIKEINRIIGVKDE